jgi:hypothetical protein
MHIFESRSRYKVQAWAQSYALAGRFVSSVQGKPGRITLQSHNVLGIRMLADKGWTWSSIRWGSLPWCVRGEVK